MNGYEVLGLFLVLAVVGVPLAVSMGLSAVAYILVNDIPLATMAHRMGNAVNSFPLLAVVLFIYVGSLLNATGITPRLYEIAKAVVGRVRGSLAYVNVFTNLVMAGISGAALADIGALGTIQIKAMKDQGYKADIAAAITSAAATVGPIFPPSIPLIIYAGIEELARFAHVTMVFLLVPLLFREGKHVTIDIVLLHVPPNINKTLRLFAMLLTAAYGAFFLASEYQFMLKNASVPTPGLGMPNIIFFMGAYIGMALLLLTAIEQFIRLVRGKA